MFGDVFCFIEMNRLIGGCCVEVVLYILSGYSVLWFLVGSYFMCFVVSDGFVIEIIL